VYITSESPLPESFEAHRLPVPPELIHDLLFYADGYVGDSQTMAIEAGVLGTPAIRTNSFVGNSDLSTFRELESHGLVYNLDQERAAIEKMKTFVEDPDTAAKWERRRSQLLAERQDVTDVIVEETLGAAE
jgi:predicted glycosyltransferase